MPHIYFYLKKMQADNNKLENFDTVTIYLHGKF